MSTYRNQSRKEIKSKGFVYATSTTNGKLNAKFRREQLGETEINIIATENYCYDIYCRPQDLKKVQLIY